jgi:methoxymalonate biosynthesis protein
VTELVKCLVWDLDNTLWSGTLLEDGEMPLIEGVRDVVLELDRRGILQSVSSKNDPDLALARLEALGLTEYFVLPQIGWGRKSDAVRVISERLNFAHRAMAFIDDQPVERAEVTHHLPHVRCYRAEQARELVDLAEFSPAVRTVDSGRRRQMYQADFRRVQERSEFTGPDDDFLRTLDLVMTIHRATGEQLSRVEELTLRTSQMNATGVHYGDATLRGLIADPGHEVLVVTMTDRFGPHGAVGVVLLEQHSRVWHLKLLATSCRVVSLGAGASILNWLTDQAATVDVHLIADFRPTDRNRMMEIAYRFAGFDESGCACREQLTPAGHVIEGVERLHLVATPRSVGSAVRLEATDLTGTAPVVVADLAL